ncbi:MAG: DUF2158 domain-containing protein, partial [Desulfobaccales bacterium]
TIVHLKSGGPKMTVIKDPDDDGKVFCQWFSGDICQEKMFTENSLDLGEEVSDSLGAVAKRILVRKKKD